jgi:hypothetical protein
VTTPGTTQDLATEAEESAAGAALAAGLDTVARLHDEAMDRIAQLAAAGTTAAERSPEATAPDGEVPAEHAPDDHAPDDHAREDAAADDEVRVLRLVERPDVAPRVETAAA